MSGSGNGQPGRITLICGCMFSGKTERLVERLAEASRAGVLVRAFKHASDARYAEHDIASHSGRHWQAQPVTTSHEVLEQVGNARLIAIDEGQFFDADLIELCCRLARSGCEVLVAALDRDSWGEPFGPIPELRRVADEVIQTYARCACGKQAEFTQRLVPVGGQTMVGGPEAYTARCGDCFETPPAELRR